VIAMSGCYDLSSYTGDYFDQDVYFNSPEHYIPGLTDEWYLNRIRSAKKIILAAGSGDWEKPEYTRRFSTILSQKDIPHVLDIWGHDMPHDWDTWRKMLPYFIDMMI
jgi:esterase/lipase superfamily enzyme